MGLKIQPKTLSKIGYTNNVSRSLAINIISKHCKHDTKENVIQTLIAIVQGTRAEDVCNVLLNMPRRRRFQAREITLDMAGNMELIAKTCF